MNICFCNTNTSWGGGEKWHLEMATAISELPDFKVSFLLNKDSVLNQKIQSDKINKLYFDLKKFSFLNPLSYNCLKRLLKDQNFDVLIFNGPNELKLVSRVAKACGINKIIYRRGSDKAIKNSFINRYLLENVVTHLIANSEATKQSLLSTGIKIEDKIHIINNGIHPPTTEIYRTLGNTPIIGAIGRLEPEKGFDLLIEAAKILKSKGVNFEVRIAGIGSQQLILQELINTNQLQDQVKLVGFKQDIYQFLSDCHIFALSSRYEGFGYVTVEAMFAKLPVVAFKNSAALEIVEDKETGLLVDKFDTTKFAEAIANILNNSQLIELFGEKGYKRAINNYHFSISVKKLSQIFLK